MRDHAPSPPHASVLQVTKAGRGPGSKGQFNTIPWMRPTDATEMI